MKAVFLIDRKNLEVESFIYEDGGQGPDMRR
jgi:hypothetical protein